MAIKSIALLASNASAISPRLAGVREDPFDASNTKVVPLNGNPIFDSVKTGTEMLFDVNTRATRRMRHNADDFFEVTAQLVAQGNVPGKPPSLVPIYASTFPNGSDTGPSGSGPARNGYAEAQRQFVNSMCSMDNSCLCDNPSGCDSAERTTTFQNLLLEKYVLEAKTPAVRDEMLADIANMFEAWVGISDGGDHVLQFALLVSS